MGINDILGLECNRKISVISPVDKVTGCPETSLICSQHSQVKEMVSFSQVHKNKGFFVFVFFSIQVHGP